MARVSVVNPSAQPLEVSVAATPGGPTIGLGQALPSSTLRVQDVVDQGDRWVFTYRSGACGPWHQSVSGRALARGSWNVVVAPEIVRSSEDGCRYRSPLERDPA